MALIEDADAKFGGFKVVMSKWFDRRCSISMLKVLYRDHIKDTSALDKCSKMMDIIELLIGAGHITSTNLTLLYETIKLTDQFGLVNEIKDRHPSLPIPNDIKDCVITEFSMYRQRLVKLGLALPSKEIQHISGLYDVAGEYATDSWKLIMELEQKTIICEEKMEAFIGELKKYDIRKAVEALTKDIPGFWNVRPKRHLPQLPQSLSTNEQEEEMKKKEEIGKKRHVKKERKVTQMRPADCLKIVVKYVSQGETFVAKIIKTEECEILADLKATLTHPTGTIDITQFEDKNGEYFTTEIPSCPGYCRLDVSADGVPIKQSPMSFEILKERLATSITVKDSVADIVEHNGKLLASCESNKVLTFMLLGEQIITGKVKLPKGVKVNRMYKMEDGNIAFIDKGNKCIKVCNIKGKVTATFGQEILKDPKGLYVNQTTNVVYVADSICHPCFSRPTTTSGCVYMFGICNINGPAIGQEELKDPVAMHVSETSNVVYIADSCCVYCFDSNGNMLQKIIQEGRVCNIALTNNGNLFVFGHTEMKLFNNQGKFIKDIKTEYMQSPLIVVDEDDNVIVSGFRDSPNCLKIFSNTGNHLKTITFKDNYRFTAIPKALCIISYHPRKVAVGLQYNTGVCSSIKIIQY